MLMSEQPVLPQGLKVTKRRKESLCGASCLDVLVAIFFSKHYYPTARKQLPFCFVPSYNSIQRF